MWAYIAVEGSEAAANRLLARVQTALVNLSELPNAGVSREMLAPGLRATFLGNYAIYYVLQMEEIVVVRVLHTARDAAALAGRGGFSSD
jgi:toxin ParE1/3/4